MNKIDIYISPYYKPNSPRTRLYIDGVRINNPNNRLTQFVVQRSMNKWLREYKKKLFVWQGFFYELALELNSADYLINFYGQPEDFKLFSKEVKEQQIKLERNGRSVNLQLSFTPYFDIVKAVKYLIEAYENLFYKARREENYILCDRIMPIKDSLISVPCRVDVLDDDMKTDICGKLEKSEFFHHTVKHPKAVAVIVGEKTDISATVNKIIKASQEPNCIYIPVLMPESMDKQYEEELIGMLSDEGTLFEKVFIHRYSDNPLYCLETCIYHEYMPDIVNRSIESYYDFVLYLSDSEYDAYIIEANSLIDELFL